jgi:hypothetical protein
MQVNCDEYGTRRWLTAPTTGRIASQWLALLRRSRLRGAAITHERSGHSRDSAIGHFQTKLMLEQKRFCRYGAYTPGRSGFANAVSRRT